MSDIQQGDDWWLASDSKWYPPQSRPALPPPPAPPAPPTTESSLAGGYPPVGYTPSRTGPATVSRGLSGTLQGFFWATAGMALLTALAGGWAWSEFHGWWTIRFTRNGEERFNRWVEAEDASVALGGVLLLVNLALFVLLIIWTFKAHRATDHLTQGSRSWSSGWTIGGWFIPVANLIIPKLILGEIERIAKAERTPNGFASDWRRTPTGAAGWIWIVFFVAGIALNRIGVSVAGSWEGLEGDELRVAYGLQVAGFALLSISAVGGALMVRSISSRLYE